VVLVNTAILSKVLAGMTNWVYVLGMFISNIIIGFITVEILRAYGHKQRKAEINITPQRAQNQEQKA
jgi:uncharacterized membrane-anchored protein YhcB (DUF1043 family)